MPDDELMDVTPSTSDGNKGEGQIEESVEEIPEVTQEAFEKSIISFYTKKFDSLWFKMKYRKFSDIQV